MDTEENISLIQELRIYLPTIFVSITQTLFFIIIMAYIADQSSPQNQRILEQLIQIYTVNLGLIYLSFRFGMCQYQNRYKQLIIMFLWAIFIFVIMFSPQRDISMKLYGLIYIQLYISGISGITMIIFWPIPLTFNNVAVNTDVGWYNPYQQDVFPYTVKGQKPPQ